MAGSADDRGTGLRSADSGPPAPWLELCLFGLLALLWGSSYLWIKIALGSLPALTLVALRVAIAAAFLLLVLFATGTRLPKDMATWRMLSVQALLNSIVPWTLLAWGQRHVDSGLAGVLNSTSPIFVLLIGGLWLRQQATSARQLVGALTGLAGVILIVGPQALGGLGAHLPAQFAVLLSAVVYAGAALYGRRFASLPPLASAAGTMLWATLVLVPLCLVIDRPWSLRPTADALGAALVLGLACTGIALLLYFRLVRTLGSMGVASQSYLRAGVSVMLGVFVLGETVTAPIAIGLAAVIAGVALINWPTRRRGTV